ncbi:triphosphoribosyl-dephospho-CoA synthase, partial [Klebsiella michiganensis]
MTIFAVNAERAEQWESIAWLAAEAMYREVRLTPKPGLVDGENNGAHRD